MVERGIEEGEVEDTTSRVLNLNENSTHPMKSRISTLKDLCENMMVKRISRVTMANKIWIISKMNEAPGTL